MTHSGAPSWDAEKEARGLGSTASDRSVQMLVVAGTVVLVLVVAGLAALSLTAGEEAGRLESGMAPDFALTGFDGEILTLSELRGNVVVINFWGSWCLPCRDEAEALEQTWRRYRDRPVVFVGIDYKDTESGARAYLDEFDITYFNGPDVGAEISKSYRVSGVPETFFVSSDGELRGSWIGPITPRELERRIDALLAETDA